MDPHQAVLDRLGATVRALRKGRGWSRRELGERTGISLRFLADIEGGRANPSVLRLCELAAALGTTPTALLASPIGPDRRDKVALLGLRGAGKSSVGARLAEQLGCAFLELDALVEQAAGLSLTELFQVHGEAHYRRVEADVLRQLLQRQGATVIATGGGLVTSRPTFEMLATQAHTVWLRAEPRDHWTRVLAQGDTRPMANNEQAYSDLCSLLAEREALYREAELTVGTSGRSVDEVTDELGTHFAFLRARARETPVAP